MTSLAFNLFFAESFFILAGGGGLPFKIFKALVLFIGFVLAEMLLDTLSVEVEVNANANYFVVVKDADVLADVLLGFSDQSHLLFG